MTQLAMDIRPSRTIRTGPEAPRNPADQIGRQDAPYAGSCRYRRDGVDSETECFEMQR